MLSSFLFIPKTPPRLPLDSILCLSVYLKSAPTHPTASSGKYLLKIPEIAVNICGSAFFKEEKSIKLVLIINEIQ